MVSLVEPDAAAATSRFHLSSPEANMMASAPTVPQPCFYKEHGSSDCLIRVPYPIDMPHNHKHRCCNLAGPLYVHSLHWLAGKQQPES